MATTYTVAQIQDVNECSYVTTPFPPRPIRCVSRAMKLDTDLEGTTNDLCAHGTARRVQRQRQQPRLAL